MKLLDQFISQTGKPPADWTSQDIQKYMDYLKTHVTEKTASNKMDYLKTHVTEKTASNKYDN